MPSSPPKRTSSSDPGPGGGTSGYGDLFGSSDASASDEALSLAARRLHDDATAGRKPWRPGPTREADVGRLLTARRLFGLAHDAVEASAPGAGARPEAALERVRLRKSRAVCLRDMGAAGAAERELLAVIDAQSALRDPDQSETWVILSNLHLRAQNPASAVAAARQAVHVAVRDGFPARVRERLAHHGILDGGSPAAELVARELHAEIGHGYPEPSTKLWDNALHQLAHAIEAQIDASPHLQPAQVEAQRNLVLQLTADLMGASHPTTLARAALVCGNNARMYMDLGDWREAGLHVDCALAMARSADLDTESLLGLEELRARCAARGRPRL